MKYLVILFTTFVIGFSACQSQQSSQSLNAVAFQEKLNSTNNPVVLDVRTEQEFAGGYIAKAVNIDVNNADFKSRVSTLDKSKTYFVYCLAGGRSASAANYMRANGFTKVFDLKGGLLSWQAQNFPIESYKPATEEMQLSDYENLIKENQIVLIDFYAPWCGPCKKLEPIMTEISKEYEGKVKVVRINTDNNRELSIKLGVEEIPLIKIYKDGKIINNYIGLISKEELTKNF